MEHSTAPLSIKNIPFNKEIKILVYNGFPFHYEMLGFILDFGKKYNIDIDVVNIVNNDDFKEWLVFYKMFYDFNIYYTLPEYRDHYALILLLTDDDYSFDDIYINNTVACINHTYQNRRPKIINQISITNFHNQKLFLFPVFDAIDYKSKLLNMRGQYKPIIIILGSSCISADRIYDIINNPEDFHIICINRHKLTVITSFLFLENLSAGQMFALLKKTTYVIWLPCESGNSDWQSTNKSISGCFHLSFSTGCKLITQKHSCANLNTKSIIFYDNKTTLTLDNAPDLKDVFTDRLNLINTRDKTLFNIISHVNK